jgi:hypothetical protein
MDQMGPARPRVSRETRLLLVTILVSMVSLWALARIRFPDRPATPNPVPPLLTQLAAPPGFDDLASEVTKLDSRLLPSLVPIGQTASLRVRDAVGAILLPANRDGSLPDHGLKVFARDAASGLALIAVTGAPAPELVPWTTQRLERSRYMIAGDLSPLGASLRPVFVGRLHPGSSPGWADDVWIVPARTDVTPGEFLFATDGSLAGLVIAHAGQRAIVPGETVLRAVNDLLERKTAAVGWLGVEVQPLPTPLLPGAATPGVMVAWVDPKGPAAARLSVMDVVESAGGEPLASPEQWRVRVARLQPGESLALRVRRGGQASDVSIVAAAQPVPDAMTLGLTMRTVRPIGAEVVQVADGSAAARAGIREGDVITAIGDIKAPTAQQVGRAFDAAPSDRAVLVAISRGTLHRVLALEKNAELKE